MNSAQPRTPHLAAISALTIAAGLALGGSVGCSADKPTGTFGAGGLDESTSIAASSSAVTGGAAGQESSITVGVSGGGGSGGQEACAQRTSAAKLVPLNIFIAVDQSGSMTDDGKWGNVRNAFTTFFQDPSAGGIGVALRFWPDSFDFLNPTPIIACNDSVDISCGPGVVAACETPEVDMGLLSDPVHAAKLVEAFDAHSPDGGTPTWAAINGATKWAAKYVYAHHHDEQVVVLLVTDGEPTACDTDPADINALVTKAREGAGVLTFAVGLQGSNQTTMNGIAQAGGTGQAFMIGNASAAEQLLVALKQIQAQAVSCSFSMPVPDDPKDTIDITQVGVNYTPGDGGAQVKFAQVGSAAQCTSKGGWYYDNPTLPTTISLCPASCTKVQSDNAAKVDIFLGCIRKGAN